MEPKGAKCFIPMVAKKLKFNAKIAVGIVIFMCAAVAAVIGLGKFMEWLLLTSTGHAITFATATILVIICSNVTPIVIIVSAALIVLAISKLRNGEKCKGYSLITMVAFTNIGYFFMLSLFYFGLFVSDGKTISDPTGGYGVILAMIAIIGGWCTIASPILKSIESCYK